MMNRLRMDGWMAERGTAGLGWETRRKQACGGRVGHGRVGRCAATQPEASAPAQRDARVVALLNQDLVVLGDALGDV